jgi:hypothetical protein
MGSSVKMLFVQLTSKDQLSYWRIDEIFWYRFVTDGFVASFSENGSNGTTAVPCPCWTFAPPN